MTQIIMTVEERATGERYNAFAQAVDLNFDGNYVLRFNVGIMGHSEWTMKEAIYTSEEFNRRYRVIGERGYELEA